MNANAVKSASIERESSALNGWLMLEVNLALLLGAIAWFIWMIVRAQKTNIDPGVLLLAPILIAVLAVILLKGHFTLQPNEARVLILFGAGFAVHLLWIAAVVLAIVWVASLALSRGEGASRRSLRR